MYEKCDDETPELGHLSRQVNAAVNNTI